MKVLVVENEFVLRLTFAEAFAMRGHHAHAAEDGEEGLRLFADLSPDAIITDLAMPRMNGIELIRTVRQSSLNVLIVVVTALVDPGLYDQLVQIGANLCLTKPISGVNLVQILESLHEQRD